NQAPERVLPTQLSPEPRAEPVLVILVPVLPVRAPAELHLPGLENTNHEKEAHAEKPRNDGEPLGRDGEAEENPRDRKGVPPPSFSKLPTGSRSPAGAEGYEPPDQEPRHEGIQHGGAGLDI